MTPEEIASLRAEVERLKDLLPAWKIVENNERLRARVAELEDVPEYVNTQNDIEIASLRAEVERLQRNQGNYSDCVEAIEVTIPRLRARVAELEAENTQLHCLPKSARIAELEGALHRIILLKHPDSKGIARAALEKKP